MELPTEDEVIEASTVAAADQIGSLVNELMAKTVNREECCDGPFCVGYPVHELLDSLTDLDMTLVIKVLLRRATDDCR